MMISHMYLYIREKSNIFRVIFILTLLGFVCTSQELCLAKNPEDVKEYEAKAALVYNFAKFVTWPESAFAHNKSPFVIAIMGKNVFGNALKAIEDKKIQGRPIKIRYFHNMKEFEPCHVLYCSSDNLSKFKKHFEVFHKHHVLTIGEKEDFTKAGGVLLLTIIKDHLSFKVNIGAARESGLEISANLLNLATEVINE